MLCGVILCDLLDCRRIALIGTCLVKKRDFSWYMPIEFKDFDWYMPNEFRDFDWYMLIEISRSCLKKNQNAPRPYEHPPVREGGMSKRLGGIKGCKYKTSTWHLNGFPDANNIESTV